jgi:aryl-alcohol dehydrogenase-like predicted oxidoreductase
LEVTPLIIGGNVFGWTADRDATFAILDAARGAGLNGIDTADMYSWWVPGHLGGESENLIGKWLCSRRCRHEVMLATKGGITNNGTTEWESDLSADYIVKAVERSLTRLQTEYIDLYQLHQDDPRTPLAETLAACARLQKSGKVRAFGASNYSAPRLSEALALSRSDGLTSFEAFQTLYNLCEREPFEGSLADVCSNHGLGVLCYSSLAKGFLSGNYAKTGAATDSQWADQLARYDNERGRKILRAIASVAADLGSTSAAVALAWLASQPTVTAPIVAVNDLAQFEEVVQAPHLRLTQDHLEILDDASATVTQIA